MKYLVDSSIWVALFLDFDTQHQKAIDLISQLNGKIVVPYCVINEVVTILTYKHSPSQALGFLNYLENNKDVDFMENEFFEEIAFFRKNPQKISFTDCSLLYLSKKHKISLCTFDFQLKKIYEHDIAC